MTIKQHLRGGSTMREILESVVSRLRDQVEWCSDSTCFVSDQPTPFTLPKGKIACTVAASAGAFDTAQWSGAAILDASRSLVVTPILVSHLDRGNRAEAKLLADGGLLAMETDILRALLDDGWEPLDPTGERPLLRDGGLIPIRVDGPSDLPVGQTTCQATRLSFMANFEWAI